MKKVMIKPRNSQISNLAVINTDLQRRIPELDDMGAVRFYRTRDYYNLEYKDDDDYGVLYEAPHYEIPFPLIYRLSQPDKVRLRNILRGFNWTHDAKNLYHEGIEINRQVQSIRDGDMDVVMNILTEAGIDPNQFVRRKYDVHGNDSGYAMKPHQLGALALYIICKWSNNWGQMRTGKTPPTLIYSYWLLATHQVDLCLYVVPNTIKYGWYSEIPKDMPKAMLHLTDVIEGNKATKTRLWHKAGLIKIVNYEGLRADIDIALEALSDKRYLLVGDEIHNIKNPDARQTQCFRKLKPDFFVALSGTPVANKPEDVVIPVNFTAPCLLTQSFRDFKREFCYVGGYTGHDITGYKKGALEEIHDRMKRVCVQATRKEIGVGFGKTIQPVELDMSPVMRRVHNDINEQFKAELTSSDGWTTLRVNSTLARLVRLQQVTGGYLPKIDNQGNPTGEIIWLDDQDNVKMRWIDEFLVDYLDEWGKIVIFSRFIPVIKKLHQRYRMYGAEYICGEVKGKERIYRVNEVFRKRDYCKILICNVDIAAGLDMNPAQIAIFYDRTWFLMPNMQAEDRITGINQRGDATILPLMCRESIDSRLEKKVLPRKRAYAAKVMGKEEDVTIDFTKGLKITKEDLFDLVGLE